MVISPLTVEGEVHGVSQRDRHESGQKAESRVGISGGTRQGNVTKRAEGFKRYVGLGDSISIDEYAGGPGWGAISLFYRNKDKIYPEFNFRLDLTKILRTLREHYPNCTIILGTIYDPTDGVGDLGIPDVDAQEGYALFHAFNRAILDIGKSHGAHIADIYSHFLGHGSHHGDPKNPHYCAEDPSHWFVQEIEPNSRGAHEIRRLFWDVLMSVL